MNMPLGTSNSKGDSKPHQRKSNKNKNQDTSVTQESSLFSHDTWGVLLKY